MTVVAVEVDLLLVVVVGVVVVIGILVVGNVRMSGMCWEGSQHAWSVSYYTLHPLFTIPYAEVCAIRLLILIARLMITIPTLMILIPRLMILIASTLLVSHCHLVV